MTDRRKLTRYNEAPPLKIGPGVLACATCGGGQSEVGKFFPTFFLFLFFFFFFFSAFYFSPTSGNLPCVKICFPQYFGITRRYIRWPRRPWPNTGRKKQKKHPKNHSKMTFLFWGKKKWPKKNIFFCIYLLVMPKYWGKQIFTHGRFPEVGEKQKA